MPELAGLLDGQLQHALGLRGERHLAERQGLGESGQRTLDLGLDCLQPQPETLKHRGGDALAVTDESEEDVLRPDEVMTEPTCLFSGQDDDPTRPLSESFEHWVTSCLSRVRVVLRPWGYSSAPRCRLNLRSVYAFRPRPTRDFLP